MSDDVAKQLVHSEHVSAGNIFPLIILLNDFEVPMNVGSIFRIADSLGVEKLYLSGSTPCPPNKNIKKTSRSTEKYVDYEYHRNPIELIRTLKEEGFDIVALEITTASQDIAQVDFSQSKKFCLVPGAERNGVSQRLLDMSDFQVHIPMQGQNSSMNVAVACGIAVYEMTRVMRQLK